jgi:hypothetical protein
MDQVSSTEAGPQDSSMASRKPLNDYFKIVVMFEKRADGGLRAYSDDVPGFVLSHNDASAVLNDVKPALEVILSHMFEGKIIVSLLPRLRERLAEAGIMDAGDQWIPPTQEYVTHRAAA